ncbi:MAG TPA: TolC family protein, partial [Bacteroidia bacterium]|nr:TolC family protein [Bacteroidia bacterium]
KAQLKAARGGFDPQLSGNIENKQFNANNYFTYANAELKQPLYTSQYLKVGYQYAQGAYLNPENTTPLPGLPYIGFEASLLQGLIFDKRRAELVKARHYSEYFDAEKKIQVNELLFAASNTYAEAIYIKKVNSLYTYFASLAAQRFKGISDLSSAGERPAIDTIEAAIFLQGRLLDQQAGEIELVKKLNELSVLHALPEVPANTVKLADSLELVYSLAVKNIQQTILLQQDVNPVVSQYLAKQKVLEAEKRLKREMIKPVLDLRYNFLNVSNDVSIPVFNTNNYKWGATFSLPLFLRKPRNEYKMATLDARNNELETINKQNQFNFKRKFILEAISLTAVQIDNAQRSVAYSRLLVEAERLKFVNGESSLFLLNTRENKLLETELKLAEYKLKFIKSFLELSYLNGDNRYEL